MIIHRQKNFFWGLAANVAMGAMTAGQLKQGSDQMKQQEEMAEQQKIENARITKALNKVAENAKNNPAAAQQAAQVVGQKQFAMINPKTVKNIGQFGKDLGTLALKRKNTLIGGTLAGAGIAAAGYGADKIVQADMKRSGIPLPEKVRDPREQRHFALPAGSIMGGLKTAGKAIGTAAKKNKGMIALTAGMTVAPVALGYAAEKQELKDQVRATQRNFAGLGGVFTNIGKGFKTFKAHPGKSVLGGISNISGGGGRKGVQGFGRQLEYLGKKNGSEISQKAGKWIQNNEKTALAGSVAVGATTLGATWGAGEKGTKKVLKAIDPNAYRYQDSKNQEVQ